MSDGQDHTVSRRGFLTGAGLGALGAAGVAGGAAWLTSSETAAADTVDFDGPHQAGIVTDAQDRMHFVSFDVITNSRDELEQMLQRWTKIARRMCRGEQAEPNSAVPTNELAVPGDTGEALDLSAAHLTITVGFGPTLFDDRFNLASARPPELNKLPHFSGDVVEEGLSHGDICVQACADDPQVAVHAVRMLAKTGSGVVAVRWSQLGFGRTASTSRAQLTPRNLFGFKDGTNNLKSEDTNLIQQHVWVRDPGSWFDGGTYLITRRIRMLIENWDRQVLADQEATFGRTKGSGAPLGRTDEFDELPLDEYHGTEGPVIPDTAHSRLASPQENDGARMLRRGYNFIDGSDGFGHLNAGLFFIAFVSSPDSDFIPVQARLSKRDQMNEYVRYESSAIFACPPGVQGEDDWWGRQLFEETA
ncbi:deferrochelatase/peroxidase EfeB [Corynebacterium canis]|uniref:Deferrochelatase n=1 Tax=Corynebacterium canis TaxID=679663 RepID=A0A5C5UDI3_9CORY|nr:iron uptake transporter deferrochelatase/peroxidase subunit [Corynebacterium canis]TWT23989.1 deferrochelatase/peroxidase EfeB [Corynebacterium canis]WJY74759.1 putative deferrochelatase/peroxidase EfeN precursor [Corynebacterium canis]